MSSYIIHLALVTCSLLTPNATYIYDVLTYNSYYIDYNTTFKQNKYTPHIDTKDKSLGLLTGIIVAPRLGYRIINAAQFKSVGHPVGTGPIEGKLADASHAALYAFMTIMPISGIAMGYFGGKGLPFFYTTIPGATSPNGSIAKQSFSIHKTLGTYGKFLIPLHIGGAVKHSVTGASIWSRVNPFGRPMH